MPNLVVETDLFARSIIVIVKRNNNKKKGKIRKNKEKKNAKDDLMVKGNDIYSHFNDVLNVNEAKLCFPRTRTATLHPPGIGGHSITRWTRKGGGGSVKCSRLVT